MRVMRFAVAAVLVLVSGRSFAQQRTTNQRSAMRAAEQEIEEAQRLVREGRQAQQQRGGAIGAQGAPDEEQSSDEAIDAYVNTTDLFSVSVPCKFTSRDITWDTEYDSKVPGRVYSCKNGDDEYEMSVINYTDILKIRRAQEHTEAGGGGGVDTYARVDVQASIDYACTKMRSEAAKVTYDAWHYINLIPGHELQYNLPDGRRVYAAVYLHEYRLYIMKAAVPAMGIPPLLYTQSFAVVRPDGSTIRYPSIYRHPWW
jgi:type II secretory pathway pseudopilin PulG